MFNSCAGFVATAMFVGLRVKTFVQDAIMVDYVKWITVRSRIPYIPLLQLEACIGIPSAILCSDCYTKTPQRYRKLSSPTSIIPGFVLIFLIGTSVVFLAPVRGIRIVAARTCRNPKQDFTRLRSQATNSEDPELVTSTYSFKANKCKQLQSEASQFVLFHDLEAREVWPDRVTFQPLKKH